VNEVSYIILLPAIAGLFAYLIRRLRSEFNFIGFVLTLFVSFKLFLLTRTQVISYSIATVPPFNFRFYLDSLAGFIVLFNAIFAFLIWTYALRSMSKAEGENMYHLYLALTLSAANGVVVSGNFVLLFIFWNVLVFSLYGILLIGKTDSSFAAYKALKIIGISDYVMLLGIAIIFVTTGHTDFPVDPRLPLDQPWSIVAYILIMVGAMAKAGSMPLHTWIPEASKVVPASTMAYMPGSLDKLLGIYVLIRTSFFVFDITHSIAIRLVLMIIGSVTIIGAVMMAMVQKEAMRLLSFHAVSQVGYMLLGIGTGIPVGIAGGLFHMINNALYKSSLFLSMGSVEYRTKTTQLDKLGGLGVKMPFTLVAFTIAALAISGIPPLNGFFSKWMIYQAIIDLSGEIPIWPVFLVAAMFGSVLTLASFLKLLHSVFLGAMPQKLGRVREARFEMVVPSLILSMLCVVFGIFAWQVPLARLIKPALPFAITETGAWFPLLATGLIIIGIVIGLIIFLFGTAFRGRRDRVFVGGEIMDNEEARITGPDFYSSVHTMEILEKSYQFGEEGTFDFYNYLTGIMHGFAVLFKKIVDRGFELFYLSLAKIVRNFGKMISSLHTGELYLYLSWILIGFIVILLLLGFAGVN
jgi:formate hydrogenlyase subunit 3/multisubunit Na+/H+ antiporter MnhD subunit